MEDSCIIKNDGTIPTVTGSYTNTDTQIDKKSYDILAKDIGETEDFGDGDAYYFIMTSYGEYDTGEIEKEPIESPLSNLVYYEYVSP